MTCDKLHMTHKNNFSFLFLCQLLLMLLSTPIKGFSVSHVWAILQCLLLLN